MSFLAFEREYNVYGSCAVHVFPFPGIIIGKGRGQVPESAEGTVIFVLSLPFSEPVFPQPQKRSYGTDVERARKIILETLATQPFLSKVKKTSVVLDSFGDSAVNLGVWVWVPVMTKSSSLSSVREHIYHAFNEHGISIPFPQPDLYVKEFPGGAPVQGT